MKIIIRDRKTSFVNAFMKYVPKINMRHSLQIEHTADFFSDMNFDAIVSPANSFGFMNGGIDQLYIDTFGQQLEDRVRSGIQDETDNGELLVGQSMIFQLSEKHTDKYLICAPTMRVPMPILDPVDVYLAAKAATSIALKHQLKTIVMPGMGTGYGNIDSGIAARNMFLGIKDAIEKPTAFKSCAQSYLDHQKYSFPAD